ncbi:MAG: hypothetical protein OHK0052_27820 [Anaerolineales bacterium]
MKKNNWLVWILVLVVLCLLLLCIGGFVLWTTFQNAAQALGDPLATAQALATFVPQDPNALATALPSILPTDSAAPPAAENPPIFALSAAPVLHLAGRTDIIIPKLGELSENPLFACRDGAVVQETYPSGYQITPGSEFTFKASGRVNYYGGAPEDGYPPDGDAWIADIQPFGSISGYTGPSGALVGVFLDDAIPNGETAPERINFTPEGQGVDFEQLAPQIGQVFFIGDGKNANGKVQIFIAPANATRLYIGLIDAPNFYGFSSCYADNTGGFEYSVQSNQPYQPLP